MSSHFFTQLVVEHAVGALRGPIEDLVHQRDTDEYAGGLHIVVLDRELKSSDDAFGYPIVWALFECSFGNRSRWRRDYAEIAWAKARQSHRTGLSGRELRERPWLYQTGDTRYIGAVVRNNIVVAPSGLSAENDELIANWIIDGIAAACYAAYQAIPDDGPAFLQ